MCDVSQQVRSLCFNFIGNGPAVQRSQSVVNHPVDHLFRRGVSVCADVGREEHVGEFQEGMVPADEERLFSNSPFGVFLSSPETQTVVAT